MSDLTIIVIALIAAGLAIYALRLQHSGSRSSREETQLGKLQTKVEQLELRFEELYDVVMRWTKRDAMRERREVKPNGDAPPPPKADRFAALRARYAKDV